MYIQGTVTALDKKPLFFGEGALGFLNYEAHPSSGSIISTSLRAPSIHYLFINWIRAGNL